MEHVDVIVAGGGPIGIAAAIEASLAGLSVVVCEPRSAPIDKACGEGLMPGAVAALDRLGVKPDGREFAGIRYVDGRRSVAHRFPAGTGIGVRRTVLYESLAARAAALGVTFRQTRVTDVVQAASTVTVNQSLRAYWLVASDGLHSRLRRTLGLARPITGVRRYGIRQHFRVTPWSEFVEVHWTCMAELYVTPVADDVVGVAVLGPRGIDYASVLAAVPLLTERLAGAPPISTLRGAGPLHQRTSRRVAGRALLVGDAAGYVDALTGEGIAVGLKQARAAIASLVAGEPAVYEREWRRVSRDYRVLTQALVGAATRPALRRQIVPLAARLPRVYGAIVDRLAG